MIGPRLAARPLALFAAAVSAVLCALGCESIVGIHPSREVPGAAGAPSLGAIDTGEAAGSAGASDEPRGLDGDPSTLGESGLPNDGNVILQPPDVDAPAGTEPGSPAIGDAGSAAPTDDGTPPGNDDAAPDAGAPPGDGPDEEPDVCEPTPPAPLLDGTAFVFSAGPNSGSPAAVGLCSFPNAELPPAPRFYGAVERALMSGPAALCGACLRAVHRDRTVDITIIDVIEPNPLARGSTLAMDVGALRALSDTGGNLDVQFSFVPCEDVGTIRVDFVSANDPSVSFIGHRNPITAVRLTTSSGVDVSLTRQEYNYWTPPAGFTSRGGLVSLILNDDLGNQLLLPNLEVGSDVDSGRQFPLPRAGCSTAP